MSLRFRQAERRAVPAIVCSAVDGWMVLRGGHLVRFYAPVLVKIRAVLVQATHSGGAWHGMALIYMRLTE